MDILLLIGVVVMFFFIIALIADVIKMQDHIKELEEKQNEIIREINKLEGIDKDKQD